MNFLINFLTIILALVSVFMILVVLMQRGSANGGLGAAMGGGAAESAFGAETSSVLTKTTRNTAIVFFVMVFGLYLARLYQHSEATEATEGLLPEIQAETSTPAADALQQLISQAEAASEEEAAEAVDALDAAAAEATETAEEAMPAE